MFERVHALAEVSQSKGRDGPDGRRRVRMGEVRGWQLRQITAFPAASDLLGPTLRAVLNFEIPARVGVAARAGRVLCFRTAPDQCWLISPEGSESLSGLHEAMTSAPAVVTLSHSRACVFVEGRGAQELLAKGVEVDLHPEVFGVGRCVLTGLRHLPVLIYHGAPDRFQIYMPRSYARWLWDWLADAAWPLGYEVGVDHEWERAE